jgi:hypothetical protein
MRVDPGRATGMQDAGAVLWRVEKQNNQNIAEEKQQDIKGATAVSTTTELAAGKERPTSRLVSPNNISSRRGRHHQRPWSGNNVHNALSSVVSLLFFPNMRVFSLIESIYLFIYTVLF